VELSYADQSGPTPANGVSLLTKITVQGHDNTATPQQLPPLEFGYTSWDPAQRKFQALASELPATSIGAPGLDLVSRFSDGLVSVVERAGRPRYGRTGGTGSSDPPRPLGFVPSGAVLGAPGVQFADLDGDGRPELVISAPTGTTTWPLSPPESDRAGFDP